MEITDLAEVAGVLLKVDWSEVGALAMDFPLRRGGNETPLLQA